jgi:hypothetical protein
LSQHNPMAISRVLLRLGRAEEEHLTFAASLRPAPGTPRHDEEVYRAADRWLSILVKTSGVLGGNEEY